MGLFPLLLMAMLFGFVFYVAELMNRMNQDLKYIKSKMEK